MEKFLAFREYHLIQLLQQYETETLPLDLSIRNYFRAHPALGSKDRSAIAETAYALARWKGLLDFLAAPAPSWDKRLQLFNSSHFVQAKQSNSLPMHVRVSSPKLLLDKLENDYGKEKAVELALVNNTSAPTTIRINPLKTTREALLKQWHSKYEVKACEEAPFGIIFSKRINFYELSEFKEGLFEVQDEGSQLVAALVEAEPGQQILDYCAGAGGKALAFAPRMGNSGQLHLYDLRRHALEDCQKRLRRAGIQNAQVIFQEETKLKKLKKKMDWVLVDVPCSGTGTYRRNPDMKWKFDEDLLKRLIGQQRIIFEKALSFLKPEGKIVYATCSILKEENEQQLTHFQNSYQLQLVRPFFKSLPTFQGMDGFFGVVLTRKHL